MLPTSIAKKIKALDARIRMLAMIEGVAHLLTYLAIAVIATFLIDYMTPLPVSVRVILDLAIAAGFFYVGLKKVVIPYTGRLSEDRLSLLVEKEYPELEDSLITTVQLSRVVDRPGEGQFHSQELIRKVINETEEKTRRIDFLKAGARKTLGSAWALSIALLISIVVFGAASPFASGMYFKRFLTLSGQWPKNNMIALEPAPPGMIAKGEDLEVSYESHEDFEIPSEVYVYSRPVDVDGATWELSNAKKFVGGIFKYTFHNAVESFEFKAVGGDCETPPFRVEVTERPRVEEITLSFELPKHIEESGFDAPPRKKGGSFKMPEGTVVSYNVITNKPVVNAELVGLENLDGPNAFGKDAIIELEGKSTFKGRFKVEKTTNYYFKFVDRYGFDSGKNPIKYTLTAVKDKEPRVKMVEPDGNRDYVPNASVPMKISARDDYGVKEMEFRYYVLERGVKIDNPAVKTIECDTLSGMPLEHEFEFTFDLENLSVKRGDVIVFYAAARDFRPDEKTAWGFSEPRFRITVSSRQDMTPRITFMLRKITNKLREAQKSEIESQKELGVLRTALESDYSQETDRGISIQERAQNRISYDLETAWELIGNLIRFKESNKMMERNDKEWLYGVADALKTLYMEDSPDVVRELADARQKASREDSLVHVENAHTMQGHIISELSKLIREMMRIEELQEVITVLGGIKDLEEKIEKELIDVTTGKKDDDNSDD